MNAVTPFAIPGEVLPDHVSIQWLPHPFNETKQERHYLPAGASLAEIVEDVCGGFEPKTIRAWADGRRVEPEDWAGCYPARDVTLRYVPRPFLIPLIPVLVTAVAAATGVTAGLATALGVSVMVAGAIISAAASVIALGVAMLFKPSTPSLKNLSGADPSPTYAISGFQNTANRFGSVPQILGRHRIYPPYAAMPTTQLIGRDQYLHALFVVGYAQTNVSDMKIGETPITSFQDATASVWHLPAGGNLPSTWWILSADELALNIDLGNRGEPTAPVPQRTSLETDAISVDLIAPQGIFHQTAKGETVAHMTANLHVEYRAVGASTWLTAEVVNMRGAVRGEVVRKAVYWPVTRGQYEVRVRNEGDPAILDNELWPDQYADQAFWTVMRSHRQVQPISLPYGVTLVYVRIRANEQLSGTLDTFNCIGEYQGWDYEGGGVWVSGQSSANPAAHFRTVLQFPANLRAVEDDAIDFVSLDAFGDDCILRGFEYHRVHDFEGSVYDALRDICAAGRGEPTFVDGKWGVIWERSVPEAVVQAFTPRNVMSFAGERSYLPQLHGVRVRFVNENAGWEQDERAVYDDGYTDANADPGRVEGLELPGVTDPAQVWKLGRYHLAQQRLRRELYTIEVDIEQIACRRGDRVRVNHDVPLWGGGFGRVKAVDGSTVEIDEPVTMEDGQSYVIRLRSVASDGTHADVIRNVVTVAGVHTTLTLSGSGDPIAVGEMFMFGRLGAESVVLRVKSIAPGKDFSARIELVDDALDILAADSGAIPDFNTQISLPVDSLAFAPKDVRLTTTPVQDGARIMEDVRVSFVPPALPGITRHEVQWKAAVETEWTRAISLEAAARETVIRVPPGEWQVRVRSHITAPIGKAPVIVTGWSTPTSISARSVYARPPDVTGARIVHAGNLATLYWDDIPGTYLGVEVRHSRELTGATVATARVLATGAQGGSVIVPALTGTYLLRWQSIGGTYSETPAPISTNAADLIGYNVVETIEEHPTFAGTKTGLTVDSDDLVRDAEGTGVYDFAGEVDLGEVFASRLEIAVLAFAEDTTTSIWDWENIWDHQVWDVPPEDWEVTLYYRATNDDPAGTPTWSDWRRIEVGEVVGRAFQFKAEVTASRPNLAVRVRELNVTVDMPERVERFEDVSVAAGSPTTILFDPPFREPPAITHAVQGTGKLRVSAKTTDSVDLEVLDAANASVGGIVDIAAIGYGRVQP